MRAVAPFDHPGRHGADRVEDTGEVDVDHIGPLLRRGALDRHTERHAGVGDQDVHGAEHVGRLDDHGLESRRITHVGFEGEALLSLRCDEFGGRVEVAGVAIGYSIEAMSAHASQTTTLALPRQGDGVAASLAAGSPGDECRPALECSHRLVSSRVSFDDLTPCQIWCPLSHGWLGGRQL